MKCAECQYIGKCKEKAKEPNLSGCTSGIPAEKMGIRTNGDRIRAMDNKELSEFLQKVESAGYNDSSITPKGSDGFHMDMMEWLESEVEAE